MKFNKQIDPELNNLISWLNVREHKVLSNRPAISYNHPTLSNTQIIDNIVIAIKSGDLNAIELGCELVIENKKIPFGKGLKSKILQSLKNQVRFVNQSYRQQLTLLTIKLLTLEYHPTEIKFLYRLIKKFEPEYRQQVIHSVNSENKENKRWLKYFTDIDKTA